MTVEGENPRLAFDIPIVEYALFNIKRFARILAKKGMKMFEMVIGVQRRAITWTRCGGGRLRSVQCERVSGEERHEWRRTITWTRCGGGRLRVVWGGRISGDERHE